jgi:hypothetical protein
MQHGDFTVGDIGVSIVVTTDETLTGKNIDFKFVKPSRETILRDATSLSGQQATYTWASGDLDESGTWYVFLYNETDDYWYTKESGNAFVVRDKPDVMAVR